MMDYVTKHKIGMIIINSNEAQRDDADSYESMKTYAKAQGYKVPYVVDEDAALADMFGASRTPEVFLYTSDGKLTYHGAMEDNPTAPKESKDIYLRNAIDKMIVGEVPDPSFTKSIGCSIKRKS